VDVGGPVTVHLERNGLTGAEPLPRTTVDDIASLKREGVVAIIKGNVS
jgi:hypothetical protein